MTVTSDRMAAALRDWTEVLSPEFVLTGEQVAPYLVNCLSLTRSVPAVLRPDSETSIQEVVRIAVRYGIRLYAFSTGHNWGYGTSLPVTDDSVLVDLARMNRILEMDVELGLLTVEPGVTQGQLHKYLRESNLDFFVPTTGAGPTVSLLGNALERGFGITPEEDHFGAVRSLRAVLPDGSIYESPLASLGMPLTQSVWKWGIGPYLDGIFTQGNYGIVTSMTLAMRRRPEHIEVYVFSLRDPDGLPRLMAQCREVLWKLHGVAGGIKIMNHAQFQLTLDTKELGMGLSSKFAWVGFGVMHSPAGMVRSARAALKKILGPHVSQIIFLNDARVRRFNALARVVPGPLGKKIARQVQQGRHVLEIVRGIPRALELRLVYQHVPIPPGGLKDPVKEGVGVIWYAPIIPLRPEIVRAAVDAIQSALRKYGFPEAVSLTTVNERCAMGVIPIIYDRPADKDRAHECFRLLLESGREAGCFPYRLNIAAMDMLPKQGTSFWKLASAIKVAIDPDQLLSPGRYGL
jgi:4-cresol dehydrogenase (hydroxylating)